MDGPQPKMQRLADAAPAGLPAVPSEVVAAIGGFCCRSSLDALICTSKQIRGICSRLSKPWPTNRGCRLVEMLCPDLTDLPEELQHPGTPGYEAYRTKLLSLTPPLERLMMLHDTGPFLVLGQHGCMDGEAMPFTSQVWSKEWGLIFQETVQLFGSSYGMKPSVTPPLGERGSQYLILPANRRQDPYTPGVRMVEISPPSQRMARDAMTSVRTFPLPGGDQLQSAKCILGSDGPCLIFMDRGESAVKLCKLAMEGGEEGRGGDGSFPQLSEPQTLTSDPNQGRWCQNRSCLAVNSTRTIIAYAYDAEDTCINLYDMKRKVSVTVPIAEGAGRIRDVEFSPDGKMLVVAHLTITNTANYETCCAISIYDCCNERIECISQHPPKLFRVKGKGSLSDISFSPKGTMLLFQWYPQSSDRRYIFGDQRVGMIDLVPLQDGAGGSQISVDVLDEISAWESLVSS